MGIENMNDLNRKQIVLFGFELNRVQTVLLLILSISGTFLLPLFLAIEIFSNLFQAIFFDVPNYFLIIERFPEYKTDVWFLYFFAPIITRIIVNFIMLSLSIYILKKILKPANLKNKYKEKVVEKDRTTNWFGLRLTHGQSLFIYIFSLMGILYSVQFFFESSFSYDFILHIQYFCKIGGFYNQSSSFIILIIISTIFILMCLYSMLVVKKRKVETSTKMTMKNYGLIIFIAFLTIFLFFLMRILCHLFLFTDLSYIFGASPVAINASQLLDLIVTMIILIVCIVMITLSYFMREEKPKQPIITTEITWFRIRITANRAIILLSLSILSILYLFYIYQSLFLTGGLVNFLLAPSVVLLPIILICYYSVNKILKKKRIYHYLDSIESSEIIKTKWFKLQIRKIDSIVLLSISSGIVVLYFFYLTGINNFLSETIIGIGFSIMFLHELIGFIVIMTVLVILIAISIYTIKNTLPSIKSRK
ncbi:MAG: hypothetical protein ACFFDB_14000 [Promethearchaeota archaeon]